ncbi:MAG: transporter substrate-binding domain-containing protein [Burkholderiaceae bacterium]|nr:transporter substrate-binding domain-containing protein [Sulfuritalea sp.]MCF8175231.1 transporter substrate-binding domain-containing protein [Burkholderiaceae bacterium]MCF8183351.1 transporter substrate-binding domain-containing protein [Polynucleobacter sp.]
MPFISRFCICAVTALSLVLPMPVRADDLKEIRARGELRHLGIRYAHFVTGAGDGFDVEMVQGFAKDIGVKYTLVYSDFYRIIRDLLGQEVTVKDGQATLSGSYPVKGDMIATGFTVLPWRKQVLLYSAPTFPTQVLLLARADAPQTPLRGSQSLADDIRETKAMIGKKSLLVMERTCLDPAGYGLKGKGIDLRPYTKSTNINEMVPALLNGEAELTLLDVADVILDLQKWAGRFKVLGPISEEQEMAAAFPLSSPQLRDAFNDYLRKIRADGSYDQLVRKYYPGIQRYFPDFFARPK